MNDQTDAAVNGALMVIGAAAVVDTVVFHWVLERHRSIEGAPDPEFLLLEAGVVLVSGVLFAIRRGARTAGENRRVAHTDGENHRVRTGGAAN